MKRSPADALRDVPPREFVSARKALAARLAREGKTDEARRIARLRRPSPVVWALNRAAAARPRDLEALTRSVDRLRRAQLGQGDLRAATAEYRRAFDPLAGAAADVLRDAGTAVSGAIERRIRSTLQAAITDRRLRGDLAAGRLSEELADPGFAVLGGGPVPAESLRVRPSPRRARADGASPRAPSPLGEEGRVKGQARAAREAARRARALDRTARQAEQAAARAERRVEAARRALAALEERSAALRAAADEARKARDEHGKLSPGERSRT